MSRTISNDSMGKDKHMRMQRWFNEMRQPREKGMYDNTPTRIEVLTAKKYLQ